MNGRHTGDGPPNTLPGRRLAPPATKPSRRPASSTTSPSRYGNRPPATSFHRSATSTLPRVSRASGPTASTTSRYRAATTSVRVPTGSGTLSHSVAIEAAQPLEVAGQPQGDERLDPLGAEDPAEDAVGRVVVVDVVDQVAEHDELFGPPGDLAKRVDVAVDIGDERDPHRRYLK